ncbi:TolC family protein [Paramuribaculum intestinale]|jgi:NodT family efflux transporter outer membrane factor (OMF) lipoprotein|uniref:TolC family protein n=2 Tax=Paramuribaculum intestinale TaxID=2094151 RepID=UPI000D1E5775|nr:TolC family protein [Paramuribaculum intestinale]PWB11428.1 TolC family protein [Paramuribaculum intestinale]ROS94531.1 TolC family protein [Muribaculaceae bacterium Isolate-043 (Harlan)]WLT41954.1 TolC family protein [Paramuribaculum intestinale]
MKINRIIISTAAAMALTGLAGCNMYGKFKMPDDSQLGKAYAEAKEAPVDSAAFGNLRWQEVFTDPVLTDLIYQALDNNKDLRNAKLNVDIAAANRLGARLAYLPSLSLAPNGAGAKYFDVTDMSWTYQIPAAASWEVDIFGRLLNSKRGAEAAYRQTEAYRQAVRSQIIGGVANCYYTIAMLQQQLDLSRRTAELWAENVTTMKDLKEAGRVTEAAVVQSEAQYLSILGSIKDLEDNLHQANNTMSLLMNTMPMEWVTSPDATLTAPEMLREEIPMRELAARPDIRAAEESLAAAYYTTAGARSAFYPSLNITANGGFTNLVGGMVMNPGKWFIQLAGQLTAPLFARGQNIARLKAAKAQQEQAMNNFEYALMSASAEVSNAMMLYQKSTEKAVLLQEQVGKLATSVEITEELLKLGGMSTTYLEVLTAQQQLLSAQMSELSCNLTTAQAVINLYQSLGGGR